MFIKLTKKIIAFTLALTFGFVFLLAACDTNALNSDKNYTVTFDTGVADIVIAPITGKAGAPVTLPPDPEREGYVFAGWTYNGQSYALSVIPARNITLSAKWNQFFTITFNSNGGSSVDPIVAAETERITAPADPVRENFKFSGWLMGEEKFFFTTMPHGDLTLTAKWLGAVTVTFDANAPGVTAPAPLVEIAGTPISAPPAPSNPGFYLSGWLLDGVPFSFTLMPETNITLVASWVTGVTISFETNVAGVTVAPLSGPPGGAVSKPKDPVNPGYVLVGWYLDLAGDAYKFSTFPASDITLKAKWTQGSVITFVASESGVTNMPANLVAIPGASIKAPDAPLRPGYHLEGWYYGSGNTRHFAFSTMPTNIPEGEKLTLTAKWAVSTKLPALMVTLQEPDGTPIPTSDSRMGSKTIYTPVVYTLAGGEKGDTVQSITGRFKPRGNGSFRGSVDQRRPYRVKFDKKHSVFGWPKSKQYVLVSSSHASYDGSRLMTHSAFDLARDVFSEIDYASRTQPVELWINGTYRGIYCFTEKPRAEEGKLAPSVHAVGDVKPEESLYLILYGNGGHTTEGEDSRARFDLNGNGFNTFYNNFNNNVLIEEPRVGDIDDPEIPEVTSATWAKNYNYVRDEARIFTRLLNRVKNNAAGYTYAQLAEVADIDSFVDGYIIHELYRDGDVGAGGYYFIKRPASQGGKFAQGPLWDFDSANNGVGAEGWTVNRGQEGAYRSWYCPYLSDITLIPEVQVKIVARWKVLSPLVKDYLTKKFNAYINDSDYEKAFSKGENDWKNNATRRLNGLIGRCNWLDGQTQWVYPGRTS